MNSLLSSFSKVTLKLAILGNSLVAQCLGLHMSTARAMGLIPDQGTKIPRDHGGTKKLIVKIKLAILVILPDISLQF